MAEKESKYGVLEGVFAYAKIAQPDFAYKSIENKEFSIVVFVDEDTADTWDDRFPKQSSSKIKLADFEAKYKFKSPFEGKYIWAIKLKKDFIKDGRETPPERCPKVLLDKTLPDGTVERIDITKSRLIANGSKGKVSYYIHESKGYGEVAYLNNVLMDEEGFIEYVSAGSKGGGAGSEFGDYKPIRAEPENKAATEARKGKQESKPENSEEFEDDIPF